MNEIEQLKHHLEVLKLKTFDSFPPTLLHQHLIHLGERWQKAEALENKGLLPHTDKVVEELSAISQQASDLWEYLEANHPAHLEGVGFLGDPDITIEFIRSQRVENTESI